MNGFQRACRGLMPRFIATYLLVLVVPIVLLCYAVYTHSLENARNELIDVKRDAAFSDRQYLQNQLQNVELKYYQFKNSKSLNEVLDLTYHSDRAVMYEYVREISDLIYENQSDADYIEEIRIYTANEAAVRILPAFHSLDELYAQTLTPAFGQNPNRELFQRFWHIETVEGELRLTYYAGLMDTLFQKVSGVLAISCNERLFSFFLGTDNPVETTYLYQADQAIYVQHSTPEREALLARRLPELRNGVNDTDVLLDEPSGMAISAVRLPERDITIYQAYPFPTTVSLPTTFWFILALFVLLSIILMTAIFHPLRNIVQLARHLKSTQSAMLAPYPAKAGNDEVGDLIREYNAMVRRTNDMRHALYQNEMLLRNAQIEMLQSQLNPHFFYGTLENIRMVAEMNHQTLIAEIAYGFGNLMRYSLSREYFVPLDKEIDIVKQYIEIQKKRLGERFTVEWQYDVSEQDWQCPKFVLFSMVENAFTHDVSNTRRTVHIEIAIHQRGDELSISVSNDGPGIDAERLALLRRLIEHPEERGQMSSGNNGRSIFNISDRLRLYYGKDYTFTIRSEPNRRTTCNVCISRTARHVEREESYAERPAD